MNSHIFICWIVLGGFCGVSVAQRSKEEWKTRVVYHILTDRFSPPKPTPGTACTDMRSWCGGNFRGIIDQLDYIQELGANAIWISPIVENTDGGFHGYWAKNMYEIESHWGTKQDFKDLVTAAHVKDIWIMVDVVPNHMGHPKGCYWDNCPEPTWEDFQDFVPFNDSSHFHKTCYTEDWGNQTQVEECRLAFLPDLNQTNPWVRQTLLDWIRDLTAEYDIDGYRIDTVKHIEMDFWPEYQAAAGAYCIGEVWYEDGIDYPARYTTEGGLDAIFNYPLYRQIYNVFQWDNTMRRLHENLIEARQKYGDSHALGTFLDNHDVQRFLNRISDRALFYNALTMVSFWEGIPFIYYGTEQDFNGGNDPNNRESLWPNFNMNSNTFKFIKEGLDFRKTVINEMIASDQQDVYVDGESIVFTRGNHKVMILITNIGSSRSLTKDVPYDVVPDGSEYVNIRDSSDVIVVTDGRISLNIQGGLPAVFLLRLRGSSTATTASYCAKVLAMFTVMSLLICNCKNG